MGGAPEPLREAVHSYALPFLREDYDGSQLLYSFDPSTRKLRISASRKTIDDLMRGMHGDDVGVLVYAIDGHDGAEFDNVTSLERIAGYAPFYGKDHIELTRNEDYWQH